jgi:hypothetical protein
MVNIDATSTAHMCKIAWVRYFEISLDDEPHTFGGWDGTILTLCLALSPGSSNPSEVNSLISSLNNVSVAVKGIPTPIYVRFLQELFL